jgi:hypothetical protein
MRMPERGKVSHQQEIWAEVPSSAPHFLHSGLSVSLIKWRCLRTVLCPVSSPVTTQGFILLNYINLTLVPRQGPEINSRACRWELPKSPMLVPQSATNLFPKNLPRNR